MSLKVAVQMDPLEGINIEGDTTFLMMLSAQARGHSLWVYTPERMALETGTLTARGRSVTVQAVKGDHAKFGPWEVRDLSEFDVTQIGVEKRRELPQNALDSLHRVTVHFFPRDGLSASDLREEFGGHRCKCTIRTYRDLLKCQRAVPTHRGKFGDAKDIGQEELREYTQVQNNRHDIVVS